MKNLELEILESNSNISNDILLSEQDEILIIENEKILSTDSGIELIGNCNNDNISNDVSDDCDENNSNSSIVVNNNNDDNIKINDDENDVETRKIQQKIDNINRCQSPEKQRLTTINIDDDFVLPKIINRNDGLKNKIYYFDENGSPKIRDPDALNKNLKKEERKRNNFAREKNDDTQNNVSSCACFSFSKLRKKLKEIRKFSFKNNNNNI